MIRLNGNVVKFEQFPNGETKFEHDELRVGTFNKILFKYEDDSDLIKLDFLKSYLDERYGKINTCLYIAYMPYSRMDRSEDFSPFTLKYVAKMINAMGFNKVKIIEPHSDVTPALIDRCEPLYINFFLLNQVKKEVDFNDDEDYIMFPDAGAAKRYAKMRPKNVIIGNKVRDFHTGRIKKYSLQSDFVGKGKKVIIVDDLSSFGGTFVKAEESLSAAGFDYVHLLVAHAENSIFKGDLFSSMDRIFTTDSMLTDHVNWENAKYKPQLRVYDIESIIK